MKRGTPRHPKMRDLMDALNCDLPTAVGYLELLWHFTAEMAPQGDIGRFSDKRIEGAIGWEGRGKAEGKLVQVLTNCKWCDECQERRLIVHDWKDHADESVKKKLSRAGLSFLEPVAKVARQRRDGGRTCPALEADNISLPLPLPEPKPIPPAERELILFPSAPISEDELVAATAKRICDRHPGENGCGPKEAASSLKKIIGKLPKSERSSKLEQIDRNHESWCATDLWINNAGQYAKGLANWLAPTMGRYEVAPPTRASPTGSNGTVYKQGDYDEQGNWVEIHG